MKINLSCHRQLGEAHFVHIGRGFGNGASVGHGDMVVNICIMKEVLCRLLLLCQLIEPIARILVPSTYRSMDLFIS